MHATPQNCFFVIGNIELPKNVTDELCTLIGLLIRKYKPEYRKGGKQNHDSTLQCYTTKYSLIHYAEFI